MSKLRLRLEPPRAKATELDAISGAIVGRSRQCEVRIDDEKTSGKHCQIVFEGGQFHIIDLGSSNHTIIDGGIVLRKGDRHRLEKGLRIQVGRTWVEVIELEGVDAPAPRADPGTSLPTLEQAPPEFGDRTEPMPPPPSTDSEFGERTMPQPRPRPSVPESEPTMPQPGSDPTIPIPPPARGSRAASSSEPAAAPEPAAAGPALPPSRSVPVPQTPAPQTPAAGAPPAPAAGRSPDPVTDGFAPTLDASPDEFHSVAVGVAITQTRPRLIVARTGRADRVDVPHSPFVIGRGDHLEPPGRIDHPSISKEHCQLVLRDGTWFAVPFKANTQVDGRPIQGGEACPLQSESSIQLGGLSVLFVVDPTERNAADRDLYPIALDVLINRKQVTRDQRKTAESAVSASKHAGEVLIEGGVVTVEVWSDAYRAAAQLRDAGMIPKRGRGPLAWTLIAAAVVAVGVGIWWFTR